MVTCPVMPAHLQRRARRQLPGGAHRTHITLERLAGRHPRVPTGRRQAASGTATLQMCVH